MTERNIPSNPIIRTDFKEKLIAPANLMRIKIIFFCFLLCLGLPLSAKKKVSEYPKSDIKVSYQYHNVHLKTDAKAYTVNYQMILLANNDLSKFYNTYCEYVDSLNSTSSGKALYHDMITASAKKYMETGNLDDVPAPPTKMYVFNDLKNRETKYYDTNGSSQSHCYNEPLVELNWQIGNSTKVILGFECVKAETDFRGRHWTAWFTPEIPMNIGPWKLQGLPGLILSAEDSTGQHSFIADGIEESKEEIIPIEAYKYKKYEKVDRIDALRAQRKFLLNGNHLTYALIMNTPDGTKLDIDKPTINENPDLNIDFLETDYH